VKKKASNRTKKVVRAATAVLGQRDGRAIGGYSLSLPQGRPVERGCFLLNFSNRTFHTLITTKTATNRQIAANKANLASNYPLANAHSTYISSI
jgi:hypothetical protein